MFSKFIRILASAALLGALAMAPATASADSRCGGVRGVQVWEDINKGGRSVLLCGSMTYADLSTINTGLNFWENWDNRISSYQTFNFTTTTSIRFYVYPNYNASSSVARYITTTGNDYVANVGVFWSGTCCNDAFSSVKRLSP